MLSFGWFAGDVRDTIWKGDPALGPVPADVLEAWETDGAASHLLPYVKPGQEATVFTFRALTLREKAFANNKYNSAGMQGIFTEAFMIGVEFPNTGDDIKLDTGATVRPYTRDGGIRMMAESFAQGIERRFPGIVNFYGNLITLGTFLSEAEKKALSPSSTETPSSAVASTKGDMAAEAKTDAEAA